MSEKCSNSDNLIKISSENLESAEKSAEKENFKGVLRFNPVFPYFNVPQVTHSTIVYVIIV